MCSRAGDSRSTPEQSRVRPGVKAPRFPCSAVLEACAYPTESIPTRRRSPPSFCTEVTEAPAGYLRTCMDLCRSPGAVAARYSSRDLVDVEAVPMSPSSRRI